MSQENVEMVRQAEEALLRRDRHAIHDEEFEIVPVRDWPEGAVRGREAAWDFNMRIRDSFEWTPIEVERVDTGADKVLGHPRYDLRGARSGERRRGRARLLVRRHGPGGEDRSPAVVQGRSRGP
jgi:hypothetical protein